VQNRRNKLDYIDERNGFMTCKWILGKHQQ
jgi:hypothetical protein